MKRVKDEFKKMSVVACKLINKTVLLQVHRELNNLGVENKQTKNRKYATA